jgi:2-isopropylmalate synthase/UPF0716 protein FxsA
VIVYILLYFFFEVVITIEVGSYLGGLGTFMEIVGTFLLGIFIIKNFKYSIADSLNSLKSGKITQEEFVSSKIFSIIGAMLLVLPGILSDFIGILLQIEPLAVIFASKLKFGNKSCNVNSSYSYTYTSTTHHTKRDDDIIDVEVIEKSDTIEDKKGKND